MAASRGVDDIDISERCKMGDNSWLPDTQAEHLGIDLEEANTFDLRHGLNASFWSPIRRSSRILHPIVAVLLSKR